MNSIIDADTEQAVIEMQRLTNMLELCPFPDVEPFNPEQFITDMVGS